LKKYTNSSCTSITTWLFNLLLKTTRTRYSKSYKETVTTSGKIRYIVYCIRLLTQNFYRFWENIKGSYINNGKKHVSSSNYMNIVPPSDSIQLTGFGTVHTSFSTNFRGNTISCFYINFDFRFTNLSKFLYSKTTEVFTLT